MADQKRARLPDAATEAAGESGPWVCSWPMYDFPEIQKYNDILFEAFRSECNALAEENLRRLTSGDATCGSDVLCSSVEALQKLLRSLGPDAKFARAGQTNRECQKLWNSPDLLFTHMCGQLFYTIAEKARKNEEKCHLEPVFVPLFDNEHCEHGSYYSTLIVQQNSRYAVAKRPGRPQKPVGTPLTFEYRQLCGAKLAANSLESFSGAVMLRAEVARTSSLLHTPNSSAHSDTWTPIHSKHFDLNVKDLLFDPVVVTTGSHRESIQAVKHGRADVAAIDSVSLRLLTKHAPAGELDGTEVLLANTETHHPAPPVVMPSTLVEVGLGDLVFTAFKKVFEKSLTLPQLQKALTALGLAGVERVTSASYLSHFRAVNQMATLCPIALWRGNDEEFGPAPPQRTTDVTQDEPAPVSKVLPPQPVPSLPQHKLSSPYLHRLDACNASTFKLAATSASLQRWFDRALLLCWNFNHLEGRRCFRQILNETTDQGDYDGPYVSAVALAHWGIAYSLGVNYNDWDVSVVDMQEAHTHACLAVRYARKSDVLSEVEKALIFSVQTRTFDAEAARAAATAAGQPWENTELVPSEMLESGNNAYAVALRQLHNSCVAEGGSAPIDITVLFIESLMNKRPWKMWNPAPDANVETSADAFSNFRSEALEKGFRDLSKRLRLDAETLEVARLIDATTKDGYVPARDLLVCEQIQGVTMCFIKFVGW